MKENESANSVVSVRSLVKRYGDILALDHFNLEIGKAKFSAFWVRMAAAKRRQLTACCSYSSTTRATSSCSARK